MRNGRRVVGIVCTWPLAGVFGHYLASLRVVGHSRRSRWSAPVQHIGPAFAVPQRYGDCRCVSRLMADDSEVQRPRRDVLARKVITAVPWRAPRSVRRQCSRVRVSFSLSSSSRLSGVGEDPAGQIAGVGGPGTVVGRCGLPGGEGRTRLLIVPYPPCRAARAVAPVVGEFLASLRGLASRGAVCLGGSGPAEGA
jgi:hypothetical protein